MARIELDGSPTATAATRRRPADYALRAARHVVGATAAPTRCSARRAAARPRCSTSSPGLIAAERGAGAVRRPRRHRPAAPSGATSPRCSSSRSIYDTMTVFDNLAFPLRNRGVAGGRGRGARRARSRRCSSSTPTAADGARGLTADAKQKISLGRGLVRKDVAAILFDEPLTVIDPHLKWLLRRKLKQIHEQLRPSR